MNKLLPFFISVGLAGFSVIGQAENVLQVYKQAKESNPELRKIISERDAAFEKINEARSPLLPQLRLSTNYAYESGYHDNNRIHSSATKISLGLTQTIFDMSKWRALTLQEKVASISDITLQTASQRLILDTATAYLNVLSAIDALAYTQAQKQTVYRTLNQATQRFNVGLVGITEVQHVRFNYDTVLASEVTARNTLDNALEKLRQVSDTFYPELSSLDTERFITQDSESVNDLLKEAEMHNLSLISARLKQDLAREQVRLAHTGYIPIINLNAFSDITNMQYDGSSTSSIRSYSESHSKQNKINLSISVPLYTGGFTNSQIRQANYSFIGSGESLESARRSLVQAVRSSFNNTKASAHSITAYKQAVISAQNFLDTIEASYRIGRRTAVDVLNATTMLYKAKQQLSSARYAYLINQMNIKSSIGTLNESDLVVLNRALGAPVSTSPEVPLYPTTEKHAYVNDYEDEKSATHTTQSAHNRK